MPPERPSVLVADRIVGGRSRHDKLVEALAAAATTVRFGALFAPDTGTGPLAKSRQRDRVERTGRRE